MSQSLPLSAALTMIVARHNTTQGDNEMPKPPELEIDTQDYTLLEATLTLAVENFVWTDEDDEQQIFDHATGVVLMSLDGEDSKLPERVIVLDSKFTRLHICKRANS